MTPLTEWQNFYVLIGSASGALIGLQFVLMALIAEAPKPPGSALATDAFGTPNVANFSTAMAIAALLCAPWRDVLLPSVLCAAMGLAGAAYVLLAAVRVTRQTAYRPETSDWFHYFVFPFCVYGGLAMSGVAAALGSKEALFGLGAAALLLVLISVRNAWDSITYHIFVHRAAQQSPKHRA